MKRNVRFFVTVIALLIVSTSVLAVCMHAISKDNGEGKDYYNESTSNIGGSSDEDPPIGMVEFQNIMIEKFNEMKQISEDGKEITVISDDYLNKYWNTTQIRSLTTTEVYYIIQDSIRLYAEYDRIILPGVGAADNADRIIPENMPCFASGGVIEPQSKKPAYYTEEDMVAIYEIIYYRIKALSSPKAFFTGSEAILYADGFPEADSSWLPYSTFYIPEYSESTDRNAYLSIIGSAGSSNYNELPSDLFVLIPQRNMIEFLSTTSGSVQAFPTVEMEKQKENVYYVSDDGAYFRLDKNGGFIMAPSKDSPPILSGTYSFIYYYDNFLTLRVGDEYYYGFYETADGHYLYSRENSVPADFFDIADETLFQYNNLYTLTKNDDNTYSYSFSDLKGEILFEKDDVVREPKINQIAVNVYELITQAGTGLSTNWAVYCDVENSKTSDIYHYVLIAKENYVICGDYKNGEHFIVVQEIFDTNGERYYKEYKLEDASPVAADFTVDCKIDANVNVVVTYLTGNDYAKTDLTISLP